MEDTSAYKPGGLYDLTYTNIDGNTELMEKYRGHVLLIVNVASQCSSTSVNYQQLTELYEKYGNTEGLKILTFPCNQFNHEEPLSEPEIKKFAKQYNAQYDIGAKVDVNGKHTHPIWAYLKEKQDGNMGSFIKWNFTKFLVDKQGNVVKRYGPTTNPKDLEGDLHTYFNRGGYKGIFEYKYPFVKF